MARTLGTWLLMTVLASAVLAGADQWPQFRGEQAGVAADDPALPDRWSQTENVRWKVPVPGLAWSSPIVWDDHIFITSVINSAETEAPKPGLYFGGERPTPTAEHRWVVLRHRLRQRQDPLAAGHQARRAGWAETPEEQLWLGNARH